MARASGWKRSLEGELDLEWRRHGCAELRRTCCSPSVPDPLLTAAQVPGRGAGALAMELCAPLSRIWAARGRDLRVPSPPEANRAARQVHSAWGLL